MKSSLRKAIAKGETSRVLAALVRLASQKGEGEWARSVHLLSGRFEDIKRAFRNGLIHNPDYELQQNKIRQALLELIEELPDNLEKEISVYTLFNWRLPVIGIVILLLTGLGIMYSGPCPPSFTAHLFRLMLALGGALIVTALPGVFQIELYQLKLGSALGLFVLLYYFSPVTSSKNCHEFASFTVSVHGKSGSHYKVLENEGKVRIEFSEKTEIRSIRENGEAIFETIPVTWMQEKVKIQVIHSTPFESLNPDSLYTLVPSKKIYLAVELKHQDQLHGRIYDLKNGNSLKGALVIIRSNTAYTDSNGWFELNISSDNQQPFQRVRVTKPGYLPWERDSIPVTTQRDFRVGLEPENN